MALGVYEPIHGSAPRRAGQNIVNPIATILSAAMMLRYSLNSTTEAEAVEKAVIAVLEEGYVVILHMGGPVGNPANSTAFQRFREHNTVFNQLVGLNINT